MFISHFSGEEPLVISAAKPKFSSPIWIEEIQRNKIFNKQKSVCNDDAGDNELPLPLTNGAIFLTEPPRINGDVNASSSGGSGDVTPRRTRVRFPVRSISEILEFEDDEEPPANGGGVGVSKSAAVANAAVENGNGGVNRRFLQTDI